MKLNYVLMGLSIILITLGLMLIMRSNAECGGLELTIKTVYGTFIIASGAVKFVTTLMREVRR